MISAITVVARALLRHGATMLRRTIGCAFLVAACGVTSPSDDLAPVDGPPPPPGDGGADGPLDPPEVDESVLRLPFPCGQVWAGQSRTDHSPQLSIDFNRTDDDGDPVVAAATGKVTRVENTGASSYGRWIEIAHSRGRRTRYAHLSSQIVSVGQMVRQGQAIGTVGTTGGSSGPHLHYEEHANGTPVRVRFDEREALYFGTRSYTSQNGCDGYVGTVNTGGEPLAVRAEATTTATEVGTVADGAAVAISCQKHGASVTGTYGTSTLWDRIGAGYIPDAFVSTGSDGQVAPTCP